MKTTKTLVLASLIPLGLCVIFFVLFRYITAIMVWGIFIVIWLIVLLLTILTWVYEDTIVPIIPLIFATILLLCLICFVKDKIRLVILLLKKSTRVIFDMKMIFVPALTLFVLLMIISAFITTTIVMWTAGVLTEPLPDYLEYQADIYMISTVVLNSIITVWVVMIVTGVQDMIVSGAIAKWYCTRNQCTSTSNETISTGLQIILSYHLGTIILSSLINSVMTIPRIILTLLGQFSIMKELVDRCMIYLDGFFSGYTYTITAMHGTSYIGSGKKSVRLFKQNICNSISISLFGDIVIGLTYILIIGITLFSYHFIGEKIAYFYLGSSPCHFIIIGISLVMCNTILGTIKAGFRAMSLCICQDFLLNSEIDKPYTMSMRQFVNGSNKVLAKKIQQDVVPST